MNAKKSFRDNPALSFISQPPAEEAAGVDQGPRRPSESPTPPTGRDAVESRDPGNRPPTDPESGPQPPPADMAGQRPAADLGRRRPTSSPEPPAAGSRPARPKIAPPAAGRDAPPVPMKLNPLYVETKSRRVQLLMQPSLHRRLRSAADQRGQSLNDLVHQILADWPGLEG